MLRRPTLGCIVLAWCLAPSPLAWAENSWVGKKIMTRKDPVRISYTDKDGQRRYVATLTDLTYTVEAENGDWIKLRHRGVSGWLSKDDAVLLEDAIRYFTARIRRNEKDAYAYAHRASAWKERGEYNLALKELGEAIRLQPKDETWWNNRGIVWLAKKDYDRAIADFDEAIRLDPKDATAFNNRGFAWRLKKEYGQSIADYSEAIRLDPKYASPCDLRAWLWATCPDDKYRDGKKAVESAKRACELTEWKDANCIDTLAAAYAEARDFDEAVKWQKKRLEFPGLDREEVEKSRQRLKLYQNRKPYREE